MDDGLLNMLHFFMCCALLLVGVSIQDVEASSCQHVIIHKKVGDTVEFSTCLPAEGVATARWRYKGSQIADRDGVLSGDQFQGRLDLNSTNLSLTVRRLTLQDSGDFTFSSADVNDKQRATVTITLHVHEPITKEPSINFTSTWSPLNESCTVLLDCSTTSDNIVTYDWTVKNQKISGSRLQYTINPEDIEFTCTVSNVVSKTSASVTVKCSNVTSDTENKERATCCLTFFSKALHTFSVRKYIIVLLIYFLFIISAPSSSHLVLLIIRPVIVIILTTVVLLLLLFYIKSKGPCFNRAIQSETVHQGETQQQVYSTLLYVHGSDYETIGGSEVVGTEMK
ncbi:uncharacterized protein LOC131990171 [Centropristis striata]|uniref:uncharacterized protein LOC131990171 n=1 Tax=Centropristis striata TaxID=184440 RepID=UPI0027E15881|nr:uncharacterized protein LOC131990171 [Centropristis striata]